MHVIIWPRDGQRGGTDENKKGTKFEFGGKGPEDLISA